MEQEARLAKWGTLCLALYAFTKIYNRVYDEARDETSGGPLMAEAVGDHLWQKGTNCDGVSCPGGTSCIAARSPGGPILGGPVVA